MNTTDLGTATGYITRWWTELVMELGTALDTAFGDELDAPLRSYKIMNTPRNTSRRKNLAWYLNSVNQCCSEIGRGLGKRLWIKLWKELDSKLRTTIGASGRSLLGTKLCSALGKRLSLICFRPKDEIWCHSNHQLVRHSLRSKLVSTLGDWLFKRYRIDRAKGSVLI